MAERVELNRFLAARQAVEANQNDKLFFTLQSDQVALTFRVLAPRHITSDGQKFALHQVPGLVFSASDIGLAMATRDALNQAYTDGIESGRAVA
jgi:hypothetical protein